jgi:hypothetical protein
MALYLQRILNAEEPKFSSGLVKLEKATGNDGVDTRLIADIIEKSHHIMRNLKLDPQDTTGFELYTALLAAVRHESDTPLSVEDGYLLVAVDNGIISFNLIDLIESYHHELPYGFHYISHGQHSLKDEIVNRYMNHTRTNEDTVREIATFIGLLRE